MNHPLDSCRRAFLHLTLASACFLIGSEAVASTRPPFETSRLVVRLAPADNGTATDWRSGKSGRVAFDDVLAREGIAAVSPVFSTAAHPKRLQADAGKLRLSDFVVIKLPAGVNSESLKAELAALPDVEAIDFDGLAYIAGVNMTPNDPFFATHQYSLRNTGVQPPYDPGTSGADAEMEAAWTITTGDTSVVIAIIDTGVDIGHPDLVSRIWTNPLEEDDLVDNDGNGFIDDIYGYDFVNNDGLPLDDHMHGTHLAGIAAANGNNGIGIAGMNWKCRIMAIKVLDMNGSGFFTSIAAGIEYAVDNGADIINLSLGGSSDQVVLEAAIQYAVAAGVIVCAATGNDNTGDNFYPASYDSVIAVGATDSRDRRAIGDLCPFDVLGSNYGPWIDVCAAGDVVWSTFPAAAGNYGIYCLTSMASPHVAGLASLVLALRPGLSADSVAHYIRRGAEDQVGLPSEDTPGFDVYHGWGRINGRITLQALALDFEPTVTVPGPQSVIERDTLSFMLSTFDSNLTDPQLAVNAPANAALVNEGNGLWTFSYMPGSNDAGVYQVEFIVSDVDGNADTAYVEVTVIDGCGCDCHADPICDQVINNVQDVVVTINVAFRGAPAIPDPNAACPDETTDVNCDTFTSVIDVVKIVNVAFRAANPATEFCNPCP